MLKKVLHSIDKISEISGKINAFLLLIIIVATFFEVVVRYFFNSPTSWSNELCSITFGIYMMMGGAYVHLKKAHVSMDICSSKFPVRVRALVNVLTYVVTFAFLFVLIWRGGERAIQTILTNEHSTTVWAPSMIPTRVALPLGCFLFLLQTIAQFIRDNLVLFKGDAYLEY